jgi:GDP-D-mannose 3',5'-epimerase
VRGRNSDNTVLRRVLNWEPSISLEDGLARTYQWINSQVQSKASVAAVPESALASVR